MPNRLKRLITALLYLLPVIFFVICYFLITATEEDIAQGAGTTPDVWNDLVAAFRNNARLSDMYAWAVINFFDYQYSFGVDTIFRLIDVMMAVGVLLLLTSVVLGRRASWKLRDATVYMACFLLLMLTPYGYTFYRGFSMIHNYLIIALAMLAFGLPFLRKLSGGKIPSFYRKWWIAIPMGLVFGLSANFPPLAFMATYIVVKVGQIWKVRRAKEDLRRMRPETWEWMMIGGMLASMAVGYILGPGVSGYENDPMYATTYDYVALGEILQDMGGSVVRISRHIATNFGRTWLPILVVLVTGWVVAWIRAGLEKRKVRVLPEDKGARRLLLGLVMFSGFVVLAGSQIIMPVRLCLPAYLALMVVTMILVRQWWGGEASEKAIMAMSGAMILVAVLVTLVRGAFAWDFHERVGDTLEMIRDSGEEVVCIDPNKLQQRPKMPLNMFQQEETFVLRQTNSYTIYGKQVVYCSTE